MDVKSLLSPVVNGINAGASALSKAPLIGSLVSRAITDIRYVGPNPSKFDAVVLVSPIWCWKLCPPMRRFIRSMHGKLGNVAVLTCMGGSGAANAVAEVARLIHRPVVAQLALRQAQVEAGQHDDALRRFAEQVAACALARARPQAAPVTAQAA